MDKNLARVNLVVTGVVQGVFYRASTLEQAQGLNLSGWVRNLPDGAVEVLAEGDRPSLEALVDWCRLGPSAARVGDVSVKWGEFKDEYRTFVVRR